MTVLSALQSAMIRLVGRKPNTVFSTTNQTEVELADLATEVATEIMKSHDWQSLTKVYTITGDGVADAFPLPADYDRMAIGQSVSDPGTWFWNYVQVPDMDIWLKIINGYYLAAVAPGWWMLWDNQFQFQPAPSGSASIPYISKNFARSAPASGSGIITQKSAFTADDDTFVLDERLITLGVIWRYREQKGMGYAEDMATYETALSQAQARDRGAVVIRSRVNRLNDHMRLGWPWQLGPGTY